MPTPQCFDGNESKSAEGRVKTRVKTRVAMRTSNGASAKTVRATHVSIGKWNKKVNYSFM